MSKAEELVEEGRSWVFHVLGLPPEDAQHVLAVMAETLDSARLDAGEKRCPRCGLHLPREEP